MDSKDPHDDQLVDRHESDGMRSYRGRIYDQYLSAFKGQPSPDELRLIAREHGVFFDFLFKAFLNRFEPQAILEVGCGSGHFLFWAVERGFKSVSGFDSSREQVEAARVLGVPAEASFKDYLSGCREASDLIVALDLIEHLTRDEVFNLLDLCRAALRPGGYLFLTTPNGAGLRPGPISYGDLTHETIFTPQTIRLALRLSGYEQIAIRDRGRADFLWRFVRLWGVILDLIEKGTTASEGVYSRVMAVEARRSATRKREGPVKLASEALPQTQTILNIAPARLLTATRLGPPSPGLPPRLPWEAAGNDCQPQSGCVICLGQIREAGATALRLKD